MKSESFDEELIESLRPDLDESEKIYRVRIKGRPPGILMHNIEGMLKQLNAPKTRKMNQKPSLEDEAESSAYRMENGELYIPSKAIYGAIVHAGKGAKIGKLGAKSVLATVRVFPEKIPLGRKDYEIDVQMVVVQGSRIPRARPLIREWEVEFYIVFDTHYIRPDDLQLMIHDAGKRVGILDFRPEHLGQYGTFRLESFEEVPL